MIIDQLLNLFLWIDWIGVTQIFLSIIFFLYVGSFLLSGFHVALTEFITPRFTNRDFVLYWTPTLLVVLSHSFRQPRWGPCQPLQPPPSKVESCLPTVLLRPAATTRGRRPLSCTQGGRGNQTASRSPTMEGLLDKPLNPNKLLKEQWVESSNPTCVGHHFILAHTALLTSRYSPPTWRRFVSNLTGSSLLEIAALSTIVPVTD